MRALTRHTALQSAATRKDSTIASLNKKVDVIQRDLINTQKRFNEEKALLTKREAELLTAKAEASHVSMHHFCGQLCALTATAIENNECSIPCITELEHVTNMCNTQGLNLSVAVHNSNTAMLLYQVRPCSVYIHFSNTSFSPHQLGDTPCKQ